MAAPVRHVVLDSEAAAVLLSPAHPKRPNVAEALLAANGRRVVPTVVRCEAGWLRSDPEAADANRLVPDDDALDGAAADRDVELRRVVPSASFVDAAVAVTAERLAADGAVEILTSDTEDLTALAGYLDGQIDVQRV